MGLSTIREEPDILPIREEPHILPTCEESHISTIREESHISTIREESNILPTREEPHIVREIWLLLEADTVHIHIGVDGIGEDHEASRRLDLERIGRWCRSTGLQVRLREVRRGRIGSGTAPPPAPPRGVVGRPRRWWRESPDGFKPPEGEVERGSGVLVAAEG